MGIVVTEKEGASCRDVLTDIRRGNENFCERDRVVRKEVKTEEILGVRIRVNNARDIHNEADCL